MCSQRCTKCTKKIATFSSISACEKIVQLKQLKADHFYKYPDKIMCFSKGQLLVGVSSKTRLKIHSKYTENVCKNTKFRETACQNRIKF